MSQYAASCTLMLSVVPPRMERNPAICCIFKQLRIRQKIPNVVSSKNLTHF